MQVVGNIKVRNLTAPSKIYNKFNEKLICIASTHEGEEELILNNLELKKMKVLSWLQDIQKDLIKLIYILSSWVKDRI